MTGAITVLGATGFIGRNLAIYLRNLGHDVSCPDRSADLTAHPLGQAIYCIGLTADFRTRPYETTEAHVSLLARILRASNFEALTYLSSTRVYNGLSEAREDLDLSVNSGNPSDLYNLSKLCGEALCLQHPNPRVRVARLSNIIGPGMPEDNFVATLLAEARGGRIHLGETLHSGKDYLSIRDTCRALATITMASEAMDSERLFNVASGATTSHEAIVSTISEQTNCAVSVRPDAAQRRFPDISVTRLRALMERTSPDPWPSESPTDMLRALAARAPAPSLSLEEVSP